MNEETGDFGLFVGMLWALSIYGWAALIGWWVWC